jgi:iron(III) transport system substrate-binding protein
MQRNSLALAGAVLALALAGCRAKEAASATATVPGAAAAAAETPSGPLTIYCGRSAELMAPLFDRFGDQTGISVVVRYGGTWPLEATLVEEGTRTPAAVFVAQDAAALGALSRRGLLVELPMEVVQQVEPRFAGTESKHDWVGLSARSRALVYDPARIAPAALPRTLDEVTDSTHAGRFGLAPANDSFQAQLALYRVMRGEKALDGLLSGLHQNRPQVFGNNAAVVGAVARGDIDFGLVNHYSLWREANRVPPGRLAIAFMNGDGVAGFVNAAGVGVLSPDPRALELVRFLLSREAQETFARETYEYPLAKGMAAPEGLPPLATLRTPSFDFADVAAVLGETERATRRIGLAP